MHGEAIYTYPNTEIIILGFLILYKASVTSVV